LIALLTTLWFGAKICHGDQFAPSERAAAGARMDFRKPLKTNCISNFAAD
jgi:hypothetical protein